MKKYLKKEFKFKFFEYVENYNLENMLYAIKRIKCKIKKLRCLFIMIMKSF